MEITLFVSSVLLSIGILCHVSNQTFRSKEAIQIVSIRNHSFHLELSRITPILETENLKDRHVVVISVVGTYQKEESHLLSFFLRFLNTQVIPDSTQSIAIFNV